MVEGRGIVDVDRCVSVCPVDYLSGRCEREVGHAGSHWMRMSDQITVSWTNVVGVVDEVVGDA